MAHVQELCGQANVYLANSKNSLRIEGQKTVAFEICQGLRWELPDWVVIPGGNLGNVSALVRGFEQLKLAGITTKIPRVMCAQASAADPLYKSYQNDFAPLEAQQAQETMANAIRIGNPISFPKAVTALKASDGVVKSVSEQELAEAAREADTHGFFLCPHTAVAYAGIKQGLNDQLISEGDQVVVVSTAHGLKFTEFKNHCAADTIPSVTLDAPFTPIDVEDDLEKVLSAALG
jgi:threonine synthase